MRNSPDTEIVPAGAALFERGLTDFGKFTDKDWGIVDCMSFVVMRERDILYALTSDAHFEQAGFVILLEPR